MKNLDVEHGGATMRKKPETGPSLRGFLIAFVVVAALVGSIAAVVKQYDEGHGSSRDDALSTYQVASIGAYPGYTGDIAVSGVVVVSETDDDGITMMGTLTGLEASVTGGYHIHSGTACASADDVGGHYFEGMADDPWTTNYESCSVGSSTTSLSLDDSTLDHDEFVLAPRYTARNEMD